MRPGIWLTAFALTPAAALFAPAALAQIEVKQNGDVALGTPGGPPVTVTTANGDAVVTGNLTVRGTSTVLGAGPTSNTTISGSLTAPILNAPNTAITGDVGLGTPQASPPSVTTVNGYLLAPWLTAPTTNIIGDASVGGALNAPTLSASTTTVRGNLNAPYLTAFTTTVTGDLNAPYLTASTTTVTGSLNAATLSAPTTTVTGNLNAATLSAPTTTISGNAIVTGNLNAATLSAPTTTISGNAIVTGTLSVTGQSALAPKIRIVTGPAPYQLTKSTTCVNMPSLSLTLPAATTNMDTAIVTLNVPNPYSAGDNYPGGQFCIAVNGTALPTIAVFTASDQSPSTSARMPTTLVVSVPLTSAAQTVTGQWAAIRSSTVVTDSPSTLSAVIGTTN